MPCYATGSAEGDARLAADEAHDEMTMVTALLCSLCVELDKHKQKKLMPPKVKRWWENHKEIDRERIREATAESNKERLKRSTLKRLSKKEKEALGIEV